MFTLSYSQLDILKERRESGFVESLCAMLAQRFADLHDSTAARRDFATQAIIQARSHGLSSRGQIRSWVQLRAAHGTDFDREPWAATVLADRALTPAEQLSLLVERAVFVQMTSTRTGGATSGQPPRR